MTISKHTSTRPRVEALLSDRSDPDLWRLAVAIAGLILDEAKTRVTLVDLEPDCALTQHATEALDGASTANWNVTAVLRGPDNAPPEFELCRRIAGRDNLRLVAGSRHLDDAFEEAMARASRSAGRFSAGNTLRDWLARLDTDVVLVVSSGGRSPWLRAALAAADACLFVTRADRWAALDLQRLSQTASQVFVAPDATPPCAAFGWREPPQPLLTEAALDAEAGQQFAIAMARTAWPHIATAQRPRPILLPDVLSDQELRKAARSVYDPITGLRVGAR